MNDQGSAMPTFRRHTIQVGDPNELTLLVVGELNNDNVPEMVTRFLCVPGAVAVS